MVMGIAHTAWCCDENLPIKVSSKLKANHAPSRGTICPARAVPSVTLSTLWLCGFGAAAALCKFALTL